MGRKQRRSEYACLLLFQKFIPRFHIIPVVTGHGVVILRSICMVPKTWGSIIPVCVLKGKVFFAQWVLEIR